MNETCGTASEDSRKMFIRQGWARTNLSYFLLGIVIGVTIYMLISAFSGRWLTWEILMHQLLSAVVITLCITNTIYFTQRLISFERGNSIVFLFLYYLSSAFGLFIGTELAYFLYYLIFGLPYRFLHVQDLGFSVCITMIVCTALYVRGLQQHQLRNSLKEREMDLLRLKQVNTRAELATLHAKINPHFLYNSLNAIASLIHMDADKAESMTLKLSDLFRYSINQGMESLVTVKEEMEIVNTYLEIEKIRFGKRIDFIMDVDDTLLNARIPRFLLQPLIENSLKHGLNTIASGGWLRISIHLKDRIEIAVADNGTPFPDDYEAGYGLQSTADKLELLFPGTHELYVRNEPVKEVRILIPRNDG